MWRSQSALKLDRRKGQSKALSRRSSAGLIERYEDGQLFVIRNQGEIVWECEFDLFIMMSCKIIILYITVHVKDCITVLGCTCKVNVHVKSAYEPSGPSGQS